MTSLPERHLLPCPFCGRNASCFPDEVGSGGQHVPPYHTGCKWCCIFFTEDEEPAAHAAWNTRALSGAQPHGGEADTVLAEVVERLENGIGSGRSELFLLGCKHCITIARRVQQEHRNRAALAQGEGGEKA